MEGDVLLFFYAVENISSLAVSLPQIALNLPQSNAQTSIINSSQHMNRVQTQTSLLDTNERHFR